MPAPSFGSIGVIVVGPGTTVGEYSGPTNPQPSPDLLSGEDVPLVSFGLKPRGWRPTVRYVMVKTEGTPGPIIPQAHPGELGTPSGHRYVTKSQKKLVKGWAVWLFHPCLSPRSIITSRHAIKITC